MVNESVKYQGRGGEDATALWSYRPSAGYDELVGTDGRPRPVAAGLSKAALRVSLEALVERQQAADREIRSIGVTFQIGHDACFFDRPWPFDVIPRVLAAPEWQASGTGSSSGSGRSICSSTTSTTTSGAVRAGVVPVRPRRRLAELPARVHGRRPARAGSGRTSAAATSSGARTGRSTCSRTICGSRPGCRTCSRTGWWPSTSSPSCSGPTASSRSIPTSGGLPTMLAGLAVAGRGRADDGRPDPGRPQLGLLRARLPGPAAGSRARRGERPGGPGRRHRLHADRRRTRTRRRDLPPDRRRSSSIPRCSGETR